MNELLATVFTGVIIDENADSYFVQKNGVTFQLSKEEGEHALGEAVEGFGYLNQKQEAVITTKIPNVRIGHYAFGEVTEVRRDLGVFVNIGLKDKDMAVSLDELPTMRELWPKAGDRLLISLKVDNKDRIWGVLASEKMFTAMSRRGNEEMKNRDIKGTVFRLKLVGTYLLTEDYYIGFVHPSERFKEPRLGEIVEGRIIGVRPDGVLNVSLKPRAHEMISDDAAMLLVFLERAPEKKIPYTDKSDPEEIKQMFGISKGQFKRAIGTLLKQRKIKQENGFTILIEEDK
ncbi:putative RNA-binding protein (virulence factor B family) [Enterococcus sp. PF1-24]|uniref:CvfB family protein n=1 Tax=unclassified Enterococcus TaxID=2608891 RepID=UPI0024748286|nr:MULTISPECIES: S1-like domain-containing RNA-binding protein [unclassified Enterococcus]MDH6364944.1 putative RNA-binding protein (virulence factor B family) [Enterococcus sp. PFB1-1]MDH6402045.1 putative RNA-binding protein (virulence factor B family) [Enterococcus sp. PF1-24]